MIKYEVNFDKLASAFLAATRQNVIEGKLNAAKNLENADNRFNRVFNSKKISVLKDQFNFYEYTAKEIDKTFKEFDFHLEWLPDSNIQGEYFVEKIESAIKSYFEDQTQKLNVDNACELFLDVKRNLSNMNMAQRTLNISQRYSSNNEHDLIAEIEHYNELQELKAYQLDYDEPEHLYFADINTIELERESELYINEYTKQLLTNMKDKAHLKREPPNPELLKNLERDIQAHFGKDTEYPIILLRTMAVQSLNMEVSNSLNNTNWLCSQFNSNSPLEKLESICWHPEVDGSKTLSYEAFNFNKKEYLEHFNRENTKTDSVVLINDQYKSKGQSKKFQQKLQGLER